jgi:succinate dehydrogenase / fumarate reductase cytochrome b subunit
MYRGGEGQWAFYLHRFTGVGVFLFLVLHIIDTLLVAWGPDTYNELLTFYQTPVFRIGELILVAAVLFHALNGIRIILVDFWEPGTQYQLLLFRIVAAAFALLMAPAAYLMLRPLL